MKPNPKAHAGSEAMMWVVVLTCCFVMVWTAVA